MNKRIERIREEIRKEVSNILLFDIKDPRLKGMASVLNVKVTGDLSRATIYISVMGNEIEKKQSLIAITNSAGFIRRELSKRLNLRYVPELKFEIDNYIEKSIKINKILNDLK